MPTFTYKARDRNGEPVEGTVEAANAALALGRVRALGYEVERIRIATPEITQQLERPARRLRVGAIAENVIYPVASGISLPALAIFYRQLAVLIGAGMPIYQAVATVGNQTRNRRLLRVVAEMQATVQAGGTLSSVMQRRRWAFSDIQIEMLRAAEQSGTMEDTLQRIADYVEQEVAMRRLISRLTLYPKLVALAAILILGPKSIMGGGSPAISQLVIGSMGRSTYTALDYVSDVVLTPAVLALEVLAVVAICRIALFQSEGARITWERIKRAIPGIGTVSRNFALARFGRAFAAMYAGGIPLAAGSRIAGTASGSTLLAQAAREASDAADEGVALSETLRRSDAFPALMVDMLATGEQTGSVDTMMQKAAEYLENDAESRAHRYAHVFSVTVYLIVALMVASSVIGFYTGMAARAVE